MNCDTSQIPNPDSGPVIDVPVDISALPRRRRVVGTVIFLLLVFVLVAYFVHASTMVSAWFRSVPSWAMGMALWCAVMLAVWCKVLVRLFLCRRRARRLDSCDVGEFMRKMLGSLSPAIPAALPRQFADD